MISTPRDSLATRRLCVLGVCALLVPVALVQGYGFGSRLHGTLLGLATAANTAVMAALLVDQVVDLVADRILPWLQRQGAERSRQ